MSDTDRLCSGHSKAKTELIIQPNQNPVQKPAGQQISLLCVLKGLLPESSEKPGIIWSKHSGLKGDHVEVKRLDARTLSLVIRNASSSDSGVYTCTAQTANAKYHKAVDVVVFEDLNFVEKQTMIGQVLPTASVNLSCEVKNEDESISTFWMRHGSFVGSEIGRFKLYKKGAILEISNYNPSTDAGEYACKVSHGLSGSTIYRKFVVGTELESKRVFCSNMCTNVCMKMYSPTGGFF
ncbi:hypothetical protein WR25_09222 [Diploscapter pachys]|uniref:Ig-like domain-containing protein n=1 Tax=Diploscapter pachys TaxID=2018661 RepID=A0A2A2KU45_9BILA|nr:hypothetical protein WR25_09222 [Diploscapter pachys]